MTEKHTVLMSDEVTVVKVRLPDGIGYVEIRTGNVDGATGYPLIAVDVVSETRRTPARDGRLYEPRFDHDSGVVLIGRPGPRLADGFRLAAALEAHNAGDHTTCPSTCPVIRNTAGH